MSATPERLSIELGRKCSKACWFCYSASSPTGDSSWTTPELLAFLHDCADHGVRAVSFGGGEPLESPLLWPALAALRGRLFRSLTTNGLPLEDPKLRVRLHDAAPDKVHVSIHFPGNRDELHRVIRQVQELAAAGIPSGVNLLVRRSQLPAARHAAASLHAAGIDNRRIVYLPMRGQDTPSPAELAELAGQPFQSTSCLTRCGPSPRFCSIGWERSVAWCSYTTARAPLQRPSHAALLAALAGLGLRHCDERRVQLRS